MVRVMQGEQRKPQTALLSPSTEWEAHQRPLPAGGATPAGHLLPPLDSNTLIVSSFIHFTTEFPVEADVALINSDWLSRCDGRNKASKQTQCKTSVTLLCVCESQCVCVCVCPFCLCLHLHLYQSVPVYRFATPSVRCVRLCVCEYT